MRNLFESKKSQIAGQIFVYIMTIIVIGVIVLVGYWAINNTIGKSCQVEQLSFQNLIESMFSKYDTFGSMNKDSLTAPCNYETLCFVSAS